MYFCSRIPGRIPHCTCLFIFSLLQSITFPLSLIVFHDLVFWDTFEEHWSVSFSPKCPLVWIWYFLMNGLRLWFLTKNTSKRTLCPPCITSQDSLCKYISLLVVVLILIICVMWFLHCIRFYFSSSFYSLILMSISGNNLH